jgi:flavin reductase (DIM6/NTAB) family NADH-FMN oxidoreductase RutF
MLYFPLYVLSQLPCRDEKRLFSGEKAKGAFDLGEGRPLNSISATSDVEPFMSLDPRSFRKTLGCFASGVTVVTTLSPETKEPQGVTVSAFTSLSLDPPLVLFCLGNATSSMAAFKSFGHFAINILSEHQRDLSIRFASRSADKWQGVAWDKWDSGVPILPGCLATLECSLVRVEDGGDHQIFIGRVERMKHHEGGSPLVYFRGSYMDLGAPTLTDVV